MLSNFLVVDMSTDYYLTNVKRLSTDAPSACARRRATSTVGLWVPPTNDVDNPEIDVDLSPEEQIDLSLRSLVEEHYNSTEISNIMI